MADTKKTEAVNFVQSFGKKKNSTAVAICRQGKGVLRVNGKPIDLVTPEILKLKALEPLLLLGKERFAELDVRITVRGGGYTGQIYAVRLALARVIVAFYQKFRDEESKRHIKQVLLSYDRNLLVADPRRCEPKKVGGKGARAKEQMSYR